MTIVMVGGGLVGSTLAAKVAQDGHDVVLGGCMLAGRLEVFRLLVLFVPRCWRR